MRHHANAYAESGWQNIPSGFPARCWWRRAVPVFPVRGIDKRPLVKWRKDPAAVANMLSPNNWWVRWPFAMIGMPTGAASGWNVLDVDMKNGVDGLANLKAVGIDPFDMGGDYPVARTPTGGWHFYFPHDRGRPVKNSAGLIAPGVDVRGEGGFVVLPPSRRTPGGEPYIWWNGLSWLDSLTR